MGKKPRNRLQQKKNNHTPDDAIIAKEIAHGEDFQAQKRKPTNDNHNNKH